MTAYVMMNMENGALGLGLKLVPLELSESDIETPDRKYSVVLLEKDEMLWAIKAKESQPFVLVFKKNLIEKALEIVCEL